MTSTMLSCSTRNGAIAQPSECDDGRQRRTPPGWDPGSVGPATGAIDVILSVPTAYVVRGGRTTTPPLHREHDSSRGGPTERNARGTGRAGPPRRANVVTLTPALGAPDARPSGALVQDVEPHLVDGGRGEVGRRIGRLLGDLAPLVGAAVEAGEGEVLLVQASRIRIRVVHAQVN